MDKRIGADRRRIIIDELLLIGHVPGNLEYGAFVQRVFPESKTLPVVYDHRYKTLSDEIWKHMDMNTEISEAEMFYTYINVEELTDEQFLYLLEQYVSPTITRRVLDEDNYEWIDLQEKCVESINRNLSGSGYELRVQKTIGDHNVYGIVSTAPGVEEEIKNIVFAATEKPDIVFVDALANNIAVRNAEKCLIYDKPILDETLTWNKMVSWFAEKRQISSNAEELYITRLQESIGTASPPEKTFFEAYLEWLNDVGKDVPALIPQVYLYYDPLTKKDRNWLTIFEHQIFDFFMLFSLRDRVVIEIDGQQHYGDKANFAERPFPVYVANADKYAQMVSAQRDLSLYGYDVYRFGGKEFYNNPAIKNAIKDFFDRLMKKYRYS